MSIKKILRSERNKEYLFIFSLVLIAVLRLWLSSSLSLQARNTPHDELLFLRLAENLIRGEWLGSYDNKTLAKGMFYPAWIAFCFFIGVSVIFAQQILYVVGSAIFTIAIRPLIKSQISLLFIFTFILFNPISFSIQPFGTLLREGIYASLCLIILASSIGFYLRRKAKFRISVPWILLLGLSVGSFWLTREESIWIAPFLILLQGIQIVEIIVDRKRSIKKKLLPIISTLSPLLLSQLLLILVSLINLRYYSTFNYVEFKAAGFTSAYGALTRVIPDTWELQIPLPLSTRRTIYQVSPAFKELEPYLEGDLGKSWTAGSYNYGGAVFMWALRDAVGLAGYYTDGKTAEEYYTRLANEVNAACDEGKLNCITHERKTFAPPFRKEYIDPLKKSMISSIRYVLSYKDFTPFQSKGDATSSDYRLYQDITRSKITSLIGQEETFRYQNHLDSIKLALLNRVGHVYSITSLYLFALSLIIWGAMGYYFISRRQMFDGLIIISGLVGTFLARLLLVNYVHISSFSALNILYLSSAHIVLGGIIAFALGCGINYLRDKEHLKVPSFVRRSLDNP